MRYNYKVRLGFRVQCRSKSIDGMLQQSALKTSERIYDYNYNTLPHLYNALKTNILNCLSAQLVLLSILPEIFIVPG